MKKQVLVVVSAALALGLGATCAPFWVGAAAPVKPRVECVAGCGEAQPAGSARAAKLVEPFGVAADRAGNWYICEYKGQRISRVDSKGTINLFAGRAEGSPAGDETLAGQVSFKDPHGLVVGKDQQMYVADTLNHRVVRIDLKTGAAAIIAGTGQAGYSGDGGRADKATFNGIYAIDVNRAGDKIYLTDLQNRRVRVMDLKSGVLTTLAGNGESAVPADGADAASNPLLDPRAAAPDSRGNVYILERRGNALRVVDSKGKIRTVVGPASSAAPPRSSRGAEAEMKGPKHLFVDAQDNVIIADAENHLVRKYNPKDGTTVVIAGTGEKGDRIAADDPLKTQLNRPHGVYVHPSGALYISDSYNHRILKLTGW
jgi:DNA-binding beta-propeller fold protein YncE